MNLEEKKKELVKRFIEKKILVEPETITQLDTEEKVDNLQKLLDSSNTDDLAFIQDIINKSNKEKGFLETPTNNERKVEVIFSYEQDNKKREIQDFVKFFNNRYKTLRNILVQRQELQNSISIGKLKTKAERERVSIIGLISDKHETKNNNIILTLEDPTGYVKVLINKTKPELLSIAKDCVLDEVIGISGVNSTNIVFANSLSYPDVPYSTEIKKLDKEEYAVIISDFHIGSVDFLPNELNRFLKWINCETGTENQRNIARKVGYIFIIGDLIDGVGIYPGQEDDLTILDIYEQYKECARIIEQIPKHIKIIICPGNHDALRIAEPQPKLDNEFVKPLLGIPNVTMVSNPALVNIAAREGFPGFLFLLYHGYSFDYYGDNIESIRIARPNISERADLIMKFLLQRRHLAPTHTSTLYIPDAEKDPLIIEKIPDFFITGHIHKAAVSSYRNITLISSSCWQKTTEFQEKVGHEPDPGRVPVVNLQTRKIRMLKF